MRDPRRSVPLRSGTQQSRGQGKSNPPNQMTRLHGCQFKRRRKNIRRATLMQLHVEAHHHQCHLRHLLKRNRRLLTDPRPYSFLRLPALSAQPAPYDESLPRQLINHLGQASYRSVTF